MPTLDKNDITIKFVPNILSDENRKSLVIPYNRTWSIRKFLECSDIPFKDLNVQVNGHEVNDLDKNLNVGDEIVVVSVPGAPLLAWYAIHWFTYSVFLATIAYSVYSAIQASRVKTPSFNTIGDGLDEGSPSSAWTGVKTMREPGGVIPLIYGRRLTGGTRRELFS